MSGPKAVAREIAVRAVAIVEAEQAKKGWGPSVEMFEAIAAEIERAILAAVEAERAEGKRRLREQAEYYVQRAGGGTYSAS